jgi:hypothetical protein
MSSIGYRGNDGVQSTRSRNGVIIASYSIIAIGTLLAFFFIYSLPGEPAAHFELATISP